MRFIIFVSYRLNEKNIFNNNTIKVLIHKFTSKSVFKRITKYIKKHFRAKMYRILNLNILNDLSKI